MEPPSQSTAWAQEIEAAAAALSSANPRTSQQAMSSTSPGTAPSCSSATSTFRCAQPSVSMVASSACRPGARTGFQWEAGFSVQLRPRRRARHRGRTRLRLVARRLGAGRIKGLRLGREGRPLEAPARPARLEPRLAVLEQPLLPPEVPHALERPVALVAGVLGQRELGHGERMPASRVADTVSRLIRCAVAVAYERLQRNGFSSRRLRPAREPPADRAARPPAAHRAVGRRPRARRRRRPAARRSSAARS